MSCLLCGRLSHRTSACRSSFEKKPKGEEVLALRKGGTQRAGVPNRRRGESIGVVRVCKEPECPTREDLEERTAILRSGAIIAVVNLDLDTYGTFSGSIPLARNMVGDRAATALRSTGYNSVIVRASLTTRDAFTGKKARCISSTERRRCFLNYE